MTLAEIKAEVLPKLTQEEKLELAEALAGGNDIRDAQLREDLKADSSLNGRAESARAATRDDDMDADDVSEEDWARLEAKYRAKYKKDVERYRERFGEEPDLCTLVAAEARAECNNHTREQRRAGALRAIGIIYGTADKSHAGHTIRG